MSKPAAQIVGLNTLELSGEVGSVGNGVFSPAAWEKLTAMSDDELLNRIKKGKMLLSLFDGLQPQIDGIKSILATRGIENG